MSSRPTISGYDFIYFGTATNGVITHKNCDGCMTLFIELCPGCGTSPHCLIDYDWTANGCETQISPGCLS